MSAPVASYIILPTDSGNTGKQIRTQSKTISGQTVHEHFFVPSYALTVTGHYFFSSAQQTISATVQDGLSTGFFWFQNPSSSTITVMLRRIIIDFNAASALATPSAPVVSFTKFTFTGTASASTVTPVSAQTAQTSAQFSIRTAVTGMTVSKLSDFGQAAVPSAETAVGIFYGVKEVVPFNPFAYQRGFCLECAPGEGIAVWQSVAGTTSDTRKFGIQVEWDELDLS